MVGRGKLEEKECSVVSKGQQTLAKREYVDAYQTIRIIATILVVVGHCSTLALPLTNGELDSYANSLWVKAVFKELSRTIYSFHMPLFMMLSGATFALTFHDGCGTPWLMKRAKRLLLPYLVCAVALVLPVRVMQGYYGQDANWGGCS